MRLVVLQSNYVPWPGYFDLMASADTFVVYDSVQYTKNDWRNRNRLVTAQGAVWLTIPVETAGRPRQRIRDARVADGRWARKHWKTVQQVLGRQPHFAEHAAAWEQWYQQAEGLTFLHDINLLFLRGLAGQLGITTDLVDDTAFTLTATTPTDRLVELCALTEASRYLTGPAAAGYLDSGAFERAAVELEVIDYGGYPAYPQRSAIFDGRVSTFDLLANRGPNAPAQLLGRRRPWTATADPH